MIFHNNHKLKKEKSEGKRDKLTWQASSISSLRSLDPGFKSCFFPTYQLENPGQVSHPFVFVSLASVRIMMECSL